MFDIINTNLSENQRTLNEKLFKHRTRIEISKNKNSDDTSDIIIVSHNNSIFYMNQREMRQNTKFKSR